MRRLLVSGSSSRAPRAPEGGAQRPGSENKKLKQRLRALRDPGALEREARRLGMVRVGERSYVIENVP